MPPFNQNEIKDIMVLVWGAGIAALAWVARALMKGTRMSWLRFLGGILGAAIASFSFGALIDPVGWITPIMKLGIAGVVGWAGGDVLSALATQLEKKLGWRITEQE